MSAVSVSESGVRPILAEAAALARRALNDLQPNGVGDYLGVTFEDECAATHHFAATLPGYRGWQWAVVVAAPPLADHATVSESALLPGPDALVAPDFVPWEQRVRPGDLNPGDLLAPPVDDPRLAPGYLLTGDPAVDEVVEEIGLGRSQVLSRVGREEAAERWYSTYGPSAEMARAANATCGTCGFFLPLAGAMRAGFGVCANAMGADGHVVSVEYGCGAHSDTPPPAGAGSPLYEAYDDAAVELFAAEEFRSRADTAAGTAAEEPASVGGAAGPAAGETGAAAAVVSAEQVDTPAVVGDEIAGGEQTADSVAASAAGETVVADAETVGEGDTAAAANAAIAADDAAVAPESVVAAAGSASAGGEQSAAGDVASATAAADASGDDAAVAAGTVVVAAGSAPAGAEPAAAAAAEAAAGDAAAVVGTDVAAEGSASAGGEQFAAGDVASATEAADASGDDAAVAAGTVVVAAGSAPAGAEPAAAAAAEAAAGDAAAVAEAVVVVEGSVPADAGQPVVGDVAGVEAAVAGAEGARVPVAPVAAEADLPEAWILPAPEGSANH
ncbi:DUF3027 domain-containing protein [Nocardia stercoris]|uniref:DUF3027 domain-containing protein n=1 Tax=Nocardia stercoris TaxID=2483361 RepID=UPI003898E52F